MKLPENSYTVIDNFLSEKEHEKLHSLLISGNFPYYYQNSVSYASEYDPNYYFEHMIYKNKSPWSWFFGDVGEIFVQKLQLTELIRMKVNCFPREQTNIHHGFHKDMYGKHYVALYYVNTNNGYTILDLNDEKIKIESVANRMVIFDGNISHSAVSQTDEKIRVNVNINFL